MKASGACVCGKVSFEAESIKITVGACHCATCRRWGGGPLLAIDCGTKVSFTGDESVKIYDSSDWAERGFCASCGSHLFYRLKQQKLHIMPVGLFGDEIQFELDHQVFIDEKPDFYAFANETHDMTGAECFAAFADCSSQ